MRRLLPTSLLLVGLGALSADALSQDTPAPTADEAPADSAVEPAVDPDDALEAEFRAAIDDMYARISRMQSATWRFHKREYVNGVWRDEELLDVRYRPPEDFYMRWVGDIYNGREVMFRPGWNDDELRVSTGPLVPTINIDPRGSVAMRADRHSVHHLALTSVVGKFLRDREVLDANPELQEMGDLRDRGIEMIYGEPARCFDLELPKAQDARLYAYVVDFCRSQRTGLPARVQLWDLEDGQIRQVALYGYEDLQVDPGLTDADFDPDNPEYGF